MKKNTLLRVLAATAGAALLCGVTGMAMADSEISTDDVEVSVTIEVLGELSMSVASDEVTLTETGTSPTVVREFTGTLPTVTVQDTRDPDDIDPDVGWYVLGTATDFEGGANPDIPAGNLGWTPHLIDGGDSGLVAEGEAVGTVLDDPPDNVGLVDQELLVLAISSAEVAEEGEWTANAGLTLKTAPTIAAGTYVSDLTLSLFE
jgi:hypothetical protein